jgi:aromatic ring hydroxylase
MFTSGNYLVIENEKTGSTEFQLKSVFYKTENDAFIIRDQSYRVIIPFDDVRLYADSRGTDFDTETMTEFLRQATGSIGRTI